MYAITGASGQLGRLVINELLKSVNPGDIVAAVRTVDDAQDLAVRGVYVRHADYDRPETLNTALMGVDRLLLISSNRIGKRVAQHRAVIDAALAAGVSLLAYTSMLHADRSSAKMAIEHRETEAALVASRLPTVVLRNGWYTENYLMALKPALEHGAIIGAAREGRISSATRADFAVAATRVLMGNDQDGRIYELAGDEAWTMPELAREISRWSGKAVIYRNVSQAGYEEILLRTGLPTFMADLLADVDAQTAGGVLFDDGGQLRRLLGRGTTPMSETVAKAFGANERRLNR